MVTWVVDVSLVVGEYRRGILGAGVVVQGVGLPLGMPASHVRVPV